MIIRRYDPFDVFDRMSAELEDWFDLAGSSATSDILGLYEGDWSPKLDVFENDDAYFVKIDIPGIEQKDLQLSVSNNVLTLKGKRVQKSHEEEGKKRGNRYQREERFYGTFQRTLPFPMPVDSENISANLKDGVLYVTLPKREETKPKKITVNVT
jgi:HSP20 family protein